MEPVAEQITKLNLTPATPPTPSATSTTSSSSSSTLISPRQQEQESSKSLPRISPRSQLVGASRGFYATNEGTGTLRLSSSTGAAPQHPALSGIRLTLNDVELGPPVVTAQTNEQLRDAEGNPYFECHVDGWHCMVKSLASKEMSEEDMEHFEKEIGIRESLPVHQNVVRYLFHDFRGGNFSIYTAFYSDTLRAELKGPRAGLPLTKKELATFSFSICSALDFLHKNKVMHRNLQTTNIFIARDPRRQVRRLLVGGFDVAKQVKANDPAKTSVGTPAYSAPEVIAADNAGYGYSVDVYSFGMVLFEMITRRQPFEKSPLHQVILLVCSGQTPIIAAETVAQDGYMLFNDIYTRCVALDPARRPSLKDLKETFATLS